MVYLFCPDNRRSPVPRRHGQPMMHAIGPACVRSFGVPDLPPNPAGPTAPRGQHDVRGICFIHVMNATSAIMP